MMIEEETGERPTASPRSRSQERGAEEAWPSYAPPPPEFRDAPTEPAEAPEPEELALEPRRSAGFYSLRPPRHSSVEIPRAPRVPQLDLDEIGEPPRRLPSSRPARRSSVPQTVRQELDLSESSYPETIRTPPPDADMPSGRPQPRRSSVPPPPMQEAQTLVPPSSGGRSERRSNYPAPRVYFAPHVRSQANDWAQTGSLSLPGCSSPRHARALQRALLLALLHEPGWDAIPDGLRQRAGWLFCEGWESNSDGHPLREIDDLATVLGLPAGADSRHLLSLAIAGVLPENFSNRPRPSSFPPSRN